MRGGLKAFMSAYAILMGLLGLELGAIAVIQTLVSDRRDALGDGLFLMGLLLFWGSIWWGADQAYGQLIERFERRSEDGLD